MSNYKESAVLTVAAIRPPKGGEGAQYLFNERQQIFTLRAPERALQDATRSLLSAHAENLPVKVRLDRRRRVIEKTDTLAPAAIAEFRRALVPLEKPGKSVALKVATLDPTRFNVVDAFLKWPAFRLCTRVVPNYTKAKDIFDFCAKQSCHLPGPYDISPCIPFQYVIDGCYARAHKMRWIVATRYGYCCEKVFSFANANSDVLAVKADKWGGCCIEWWYHVAPLVRVRVTLGKLSAVLAMVIDPGMFDKPVLLSTWLAAQENTTCNPHANVSTYSIQAGSAYAPTNYAGTTFSTDPAYTATDATLTAYHSGVTCP